MLGYTGGIFVVIALSFHSPTYADSVEKYPDVRRCQEWTVNYFRPVRIAHGIRLYQRLATQANQVRYLDGNANRDESQHPMLVKQRCSNRRSFPSVAAPDKLDGKISLLT